VTFGEFVGASAWEAGNSSVEVHFPLAIVEMPAVEGRSPAYPGYLACAAVEDSSLNPYPGPGYGSLAAGTSGTSAEAASSYSDGGYPADSCSFHPFHPFQVGQGAYRPSG